MARAAQRKIKHPSKLLVAMQRHAKCGQLDASRQLLNNALLSEDRERIIEYIALYLSRCLTGVVPDPVRWNPPL